MKQTHLITAAALLALSPLVQAVDKHEPAFSRVIVDEFEARDADEGTVAAWEAAAWYGGDLNKLYLSTEGERLMDNGGETEGFETRVLGLAARRPPGLAAGRSEPGLGQFRGSRAGALSVRKRGHPVRR